MPALSMASFACPKCASTKKSGRHSCCARGGAWFKNCGYAGETKFGHTWAEGIQACQGFSSSVLVESSLRVIPRNVGASVDPLNATHSRNTAQQQINISRVDIVSNSSDSTDCVGLTKTVYYFCVLLIALSLQCSFTSSIYIYELSRIINVRHQRRQT